MAESSEYVLLDTKSFDTFMAQKESLVQRYHQINTTYDDIVKTLLSNWLEKVQMPLKLMPKR